MNIENKNENNKLEKKSKNTLSKFGFKKNKNVSFDSKDKDVIFISNKTLGQKITKKNVFEIINNYEQKNKLQVDNKTAKILKKAANKKRPKDDHKDLKNTENKVVDVINISKYYLSGNNLTRVLKNISFTIDKGEFILIYGKSGGGKSTLLNLISGLDRPNNGDLIVCDNNLPYLSDNQLTLFRRKHVSFIFQSYNLLQNLNGYDNVATGGQLQKDKEKRLNLDELFKEFELEDVKEKYPSQMSGGQQQRISILRALAKNAEIIFADEPTGALDEKTSRIVLSYLFDINKKLGTTIIMVTHDPNITPIADKIIRVANGKISKIEYNKDPIHPSKLKENDF